MKTYKVTITEKLQMTVEVENQSWWDRLPTVVKVILGIIGGGLFIPIAIVMSISHVSGRAKTRVENPSKSKDFDGRGGVTE